MVTGTQISNNDNVKKIEFEANISNNFHKNIEIDTNTIPKNCLKINKKFKLHQINITKIHLENCNLIKVRNVVIL